MLEDEQVRRADAKHHGWVAVQAVEKLTLPGSRQIFAHGERIDVANASMIEITRARMVMGVGAFPEIVRRQGENADDPSDPIVRQTVAEERSVAAIVLNHEEAHEESCGRHDEQQGNPVAVV
jgi:hypothetical protein